MPSPQDLLFLLYVPVLLTSALAQTCYYPNGSPTTVDAPCPNSALCCPLSWQCLSNGLCHDPANDYLERRTCTDRGWESDDCPGFCTYSAGGNEAVLQCRDGSFCCDGNRVSFDCCEGTLPPGTDYFDLADGKVVGSITALSPVSTPAAESSASTEESSSSDTPSPSSRSSSASSATSESRTSSSSASSSDLATATPAAPLDSDRESPFGHGTIIGVAVGVAALVGLCAFIAFLLYRRRKKSQTTSSSIDSSNPPPTEIRYSAAIPPGTHAPELDSSPKAPTGGISELPGSEPDMRYSTVSSLTMGAQGYSPTSMVSPAMSQAGRMDKIEEKDEPGPAQMWSQPVYQPYRPGLERRQGQGEGGAGQVQPYAGT